MRTLKTIVAVALLMMGTAAMAQGGGNRQMRSASERAKSESKMLVKALDLNANQEAQIQAINLKYAQMDSVKMAGMRSQSGQFDRDAMRKEMQTQREARSSEIKSVLTDDQKAKYEEFLKQNQGQRQGGQRQGGPRQGGQRGQGGRGGFGGGNQGGE